MHAAICQQVVDFSRSVHVHVATAYSIVRTCVLMQNMCIIILCLVNSDRCTMFVMRKLWMWTIHGLFAQSVDHAKRKAQSMDSDNSVILMYAMRAGFAGMKLSNCLYCCKSCHSSSDRKVWKIYCPKDGSSFKLVQTVTSTA